MCLYPAAIPALIRRTVSFNYKRDDAYVQYEYGCHEGNYAVPNSLRGQRAQERR